MAITNPDLTRVTITVRKDTLAAFDVHVDRLNEEERRRRDKGRGSKPIVKREQLLRGAIERAAKDIGRKR